MPAARRRAATAGRACRAIPEERTGSALLAASGERGSLRATVAELLPPATRIEPRPDGVERLAPAFDRFAAALAERGWIAPDLAAAAAHA